MKPDDFPSVHSHQRAKIFYGWWISLAAAIQAFWVSGCFLYGFTAFINPILSEFGWNASAIAIAISLQRTEAGIAGPFVGFLLDRFGARLVILAGTLVTAFGFFVLARIDSLSQFYWAFGIIALGISMGTFIATTTVLNNWFKIYRSRALSIAFTGPGLGGLIVPLLVLVIASHGWRASLDMIAIGTLIIGIPIVLVMRFRPEDYGMQPDGVSGNITTSDDLHSGNEAKLPGSIKEVDMGLREALRCPAYYQLAIAMGFAGVAMVTVTIFVIPAMESYGFSTTNSGLVVLLLTSVSLLGRWGLGFLGDILDKRYVLAISYLLVASGTLIFATIRETWQVAIFLLLYPPGHGGSIPVRFALIGDYFGRTSYGTLVGITMTITAAFGIAGPLFAAWMFDHTGSFRVAFAIIAMLAILGVPLTLTARKPVVSQRKLTDL